MKVAVIGSNRGIGLGLVQKLAQNHEVYAFCRQASEALQTVSDVHIIEACDVSSSSSLKAAIEKVNGVAFDWVLVVSGIMTKETLDQFNEDAILKQFHVNAFGVLNCARLFATHVVSGGKIGLMTSRMGSIADNSSGGSYGYRMSKAALNAGGKSLSHDLAEKGISVFLLHPGWVKTDMTGNTGLMTVEESVEGIVKVMSEKTSEQSGTFWHSNGEELSW